MKKNVMIFALLAACGGTPSETDIDANEKADDNRAGIVGKWERTSPFVPDGINNLNLAADKSFSVSVARACLVPGCEKETGTYKLTHGTKNYYLYLNLEDGSRLGKFKYTGGADALHLENVTTHAETDFVRVTEAE